MVTATAGLAAAEIAVATGLSAAPEAGAREAMAGAVRATGGQGLAAAAKATTQKHTILIAVEYGRQGVAGPRHSRPGCGHQPCRGNRGRHGMKRARMQHAEGLDGGWEAPDGALEGVGGFGAPGRLRGPAGVLGASRLGARGG